MWNGLVAERRGIERNKSLLSATCWEPSGGINGLNGVSATPVVIRGLQNSSPIWRTCYALREKTEPGRLVNRLSSN